MQRLAVSDATFSSLSSSMPRRLPEVALDKIPDILREVRLMPDKSLLHIDREKYMFLYLAAWSADALV